MPAVLFTPPFAPLAPPAAGPHLFYNCPSGNYYDYKAFAMGARSQVWWGLGAVSH